MRDERPFFVQRGEKKSTILVAEGNKESVILDAEAEKQAAILRAEAKKEATIQEAAGQAEAILKIQQANADGLRMLKEANPDNAVLQIKSLDGICQGSRRQGYKDNHPFRDSGDCRSYKVNCRDSCRIRLRSNYI